ncbi:MAG: SIMPL domain-containing protein [Bacteroidetes bacterium]|nr:SIMPL domain-containing protein [Bacteroidota bacterium]
MKLFPLLGIILCTQAQAQIQKFIEVTVTDSIHVKPDLFVYRISMADFTTTVSSDGRNKLRNEPKRKNTLMDTVRQELTKLKFHILPATVEDSTSVSPYPMDNEPLPVIVTLQSPDSLGALIDYVRMKKRLTGSLDRASTQNEALYYDKLYKKLIDAAQAKAEKLAAYSHQTILTVLSITEVPEKSAAIGGWTSYPPLSDLAAQSVVPGWHTTIGPSSFWDNSHFIAARLVVRFATQ